jgi:glycosyltransferase involved in cell wall biosynthesis
MNKMLILSYYFTPCPLTPAQRITYWGENLAKLGVYPTIITREWSDNIKTHQDTKTPLGTAVRYEKNSNFEVYYLPFRPGILDKAYLKWGESKFRFLFFIIKIIDVFLVSLTLRFTSYFNLFQFLNNFIKNNKVNFLLISGEPFYLFKIGFLINKRHKVNWIADYRDDWTTNELQKNKSKGFLRFLIFKIERIYEKRWLSNSLGAIYVSDLYTNRISKLLNLPGYTIENGFAEDLLGINESTLFDEFTVVYSGTLYPSQNIKLILETLEIAIENNNPFHLVFLGSAYDLKEKSRISKMISSKLSPYVKYTERLKREEALMFLSRSHVLLGIAYGEMKGIPSSKLYEYMALKKPILLCPTDNDIMEMKLTESGLGFFANDSKSSLIAIDNIKDLYKSGRIDKFRYDSSKKIAKYSRGNQMIKLKQIFDEYL